MYQSLYKSDEKCSMYGQNSICALELYMTFTAPLSTEFIKTYGHCVGIFYADYHPDRLRNMKE
jgi:hypothetical protein